MSNAPIGVVKLVNIRGFLTPEPPRSTIAKLILNNNEKFDNVKHLNMIINEIGKLDTIKLMSICSSDRLFYASFF